MEGKVWILRGNVLPGPFIQITNNMIKQILEAKHGGFRFIIDGVYEEGAYLYIYKNDSCEYDYLQDDIEMCKYFANNHFGIPIEEWQEYNGEPEPEWNYFHYLKNNQKTDKESNR
jgi:hypothetical protein